MSNQGLSSIDNLIEKINHVETEISTRAIKNLETKINLKTINLFELDSNTINKLILALIDWVAKNNYNEQEIFVYKAIFIAKESLKYTNDVIKRNLKSKNTLNLISNVLNSKINQNISDVCEEFINVFLCKDNSQHIDQDKHSNQNTFDFLDNNGKLIKNSNNKNLNLESNIYQNNTFNNNFSQERGQNFTFDNHFYKTSYINNSVNNGIENIISPITNNNLSITQKFNHTFNDYSAVKTNNSGDHKNNYKNNNYGIDPSKNSKNIESINKTYHSSISPHTKNDYDNSSNAFKILNLQEEKKLTNYTKNFIKNNMDNIENVSKIIINDNFNLNGVSTFPLLNISKQEEQIVFDANINLKFGDSLHISKTLNYFYFYILTEYPIEYILQNSEIIKTILILLEKSNHLEYGNILFRILHKVFDLIEKKIHLFSHNLSNKSNPLSNFTKVTNLGSSQIPIFYPNFSINYQPYNSQNNQNKIRGGSNELKISIENTISVRDFLIICAEALIISTFSHEKLPYAVILLEKNFTFLKKLMIESNEDEWTIIIRQLFKQIYEVILHYKSKGINFHLLSLVLLRFVLSLSDTALSRFSSNSNLEIITIVKEILFIFDDSTSNLAEKTIMKIKRIISKNLGNNKLLEVLKEFISEYEKAEIIKASVDIAKRIDKNNVEISIQNESKASKSSIEEFSFILNNFNNILLAYKYFIDTNEQNFMNRILILLREKENQGNLGWYPNSNSNVFSRYRPYSYTNDESNNMKNKMRRGENEIVVGNNNEFSFIKFLNRCMTYVSTDENYLYNDKKNFYIINKNKDFSISQLSYCFVKLISFLNSLNPDSPFKYLTYLDFLYETQESKNLIILLNQSREILLGIINDLAQSVESKNKKLEMCILEIIYEIHNKLDNNEFNPESEKISNNFNFLFEFLPVYLENTKMLSLNAKIEKLELNLNSKILKYLRLLFSTNESIRLNTINYFKSLFTLNANLDFLEDKIIEYVEFTNSYEKLKRLDLIYSIQTADKEYETLYNYILSNYQSIQMEFYPLLNILYSNKMDYNIKTASIEQLIYLTFDIKFSQNFCNEILFFCFEILLIKFTEYKNMFEKKIVFDKDEKTGENFIQDYNNLNNFVDEFFKEGNLNYISVMMKLINFIIINNSESDSVKNFLDLKKNDNLINFLNGIIIVLFPNDYTENVLNSDLKKPKRKHLLNVNLVYFLYLVAFNLKISFNKKITKNIILNTDLNRRVDENNKEYVRNKQNILLESYSCIEVHKQYFFNIIPIKNYVRFSLDIFNKATNDENLNDVSNEPSLNNKFDENEDSKIKDKLENYNIKRHIIEFIKFKSFYHQKSQSDKKNYEMILNDLFDEKDLKKNLIYYLNESNESNQPNFMEIFINTSKLFEFYLSENYRLLFSNISSKHISGEKDRKVVNENEENLKHIGMNNDNVNNDNNTDNLNSINSKTNYELKNFENKESNLLIQILSYLKCLLPHTAEERNIIMDILNSIKIFLSFYKDFLNGNNTYTNISNTNRHTYNNVDVTNYERCLRESENSYNDVFLPLFKKGLNDCLYNYLTFICNQKNFISEFQKNTENQLFLIEILELIISKEEIFDAEFFLTNVISIMFLIKTLINLVCNSDLLSTARLLITKLAINLFKFAICDDSQFDKLNNVNMESVSKQNKAIGLNKYHKNTGCLKLNSFICENRNFISLIIDSIDFFVSNHKHDRIKNLQKTKFNQKNNYVEYNEDDLGNINIYYPQDPSALEFKDMSLLKSNLLLLSRILDFTNNNLIGSHKIFYREVQNKISSKSFTLLRFFEFNLGTEMNDTNNKVCDNLVFVDVIILILDILEKIKTPEGKLQIIKTNPMILSSLFDFIQNIPAQNILVISIVNFINLLILDLLKNDNYSHNQANVEFSGEHIVNMGSSLNKNKCSEKYSDLYENREFQENKLYQNNNCNDNNSSQKIDKINPLNEYAIQGSFTNYNNPNQDCNQHHFLNNDNFIEEIIILNEKIYDISSLRNLLNLIKKNMRSSLLCASLTTLLKKLILFAKIRNESNDMQVKTETFNNHDEGYEENNIENKNRIKSNLYDLISNTGFFEIQNDIFKTELENFEFIVNFGSDDFLNLYSPISARFAKKAQNKNNNTEQSYTVAYYNEIYYDKLNFKVNKLHEITESLMFIGNILDMFSIIFAKCSNFPFLFEKNKIIILENLNNLFKLFLMVKSLKRKLNKKDFLLFFEANGFSKIFESITTKFFSLFHLLYFKDARIVNEDFLEISLFFDDYNKANLKEKFNNINEFNINYKLQNSILNRPSKKLDVEFDNQSRSSIKEEQNNIFIHEKNDQLSNKGNTIKIDLLNENISIKEPYQSTKAYKFIHLCYDLLTFEENDDLEIKVYFSKVLPYIIETITYFNKKIQTSNIEICTNNFIDISSLGDKNKTYSLYDNVFAKENEDSNDKFLRLKNEGDTILHLMTGLKQVYKIKYEKHDLKTKIRFNFENSEITEKNTLLFAVSSLLLVSQTAKRIFIKSNFIITFIEYIKQLSEKLLEINLDKSSREKEYEKINRSKITSDININNINNTNISYSRNNSNELLEDSQNKKRVNLDYIISEYKNVLILLQNLFCDFQNCEEKESLFIPIDIIHQNFLNSNITNISNLNMTGRKNIDANNQSLISKTSGKNTNLTPSTMNINTASKTLNNKKKEVLKATQNVNRKTDNYPINSDYGKNIINSSGLNSTDFNSHNYLASNFLKTLYEIFQDTIRYEIIHENYLKLLINIISKNDHAKKAFIISVTNPEAIGNKDSFIIILLEYLQKKFLNNNLNNTYFSNEANIVSLELFINLLKCLFQNKQVVLFLLKIKFVENFQKDLIALLSNKRFYINRKNQICLTYLLELFVSLSFDNEIRKKIADKDLIEIFTDAIIKIKNENVVYNILFVLRNLSFFNQNKTHFLANENLLGTIFAVLSGEFSLKTKYMISHLLWILLFNNQTLKAILNKEAFKNELISTQLHLQKEQDMKKYLLEEEPGSIGYSKYDKYLEESCMNFKKIIHILDT